MNTMKTKRDMSFEIEHAVKSLGVSYRQIAIAANVSASTISCAARHGYKVNHSTHLAIAQGIQSLMPTHAARCIAQPVDADGVSFAQGHEISTEQLAQGLQDQVDAMRNTITGSGLVDDLLESAHSREKAELQTALVERVDQLAQANLSVARKDDQLVYLRTEIKRLNAMLERSNAQAQSSLAELTKAQKRIACQSENIEALQQQLSAERVSYSDKIERLQSDLDLMQHEYTKSQTALTNSDKRITQITQDKVKLSHERDRLPSRAEVFKITAFTFGALWLVTLFCLIVIVAG